jgi:hypothetical protein
LLTARDDGTCSQAACTAWTAAPSAPLRLLRNQSGLLLNFLRRAAQDAEWRKALRPSVSEGVWHVSGPIRSGMFVGRRMAAAEAEADGADALDPARFLCLRAKVFLDDPRWPSIERALTDTVPTSSLPIFALPMLSPGVRAQKRWGKAPARVHHEASFHA